MFNITPPNNNEYQKDLANQAYQIFSAEVIDIILDDKHVDYLTPEDIGNIKFRKTTEINKGEKILSIASPISPYNKIYPLKHEMVLIISAASPTSAVSQGKLAFYYLSLINIWHHINHNALPTATEFIKSTNATSTNYTQFTGNLPNTTSPQDAKFGDTFKENANVTPLQPYEGDIIKYGRFGQTIRFGSTVKKSKNAWSKKGNDGDPIIIISNTKQDKSSKPFRIEDINKDSTSLYICDGQAIPIDAASINLKSFDAKKQSVVMDRPKKFKDYEGKQLIINTDRILFNAKKESIYLSGAISVSLTSKKTVNIDADKGIILNSPKMVFGSNAQDKALLGSKFMSDIMQPLLQELSKLQSIGGSAVGPVTSNVLPTHIAQFATLLGKLNLMLSQKVYIE